LSTIHDLHESKTTAETATMPVDLPTLVVPNASAWRQWLAREAATSKGVWLTLAKKGTTDPTTLTQAQAVEEALCYGWIDSQSKGGGERIVYQRFTPRTTKSIWSQRNIGNVARLDSEGRMTARGWEEVERAKADGRWERAYAGPATMEPPKEFLDAVAKVPEAQAMWETLTSQNRFAMCFRLCNLKTEAGRQKRIASYVDMLASGQTIYPQKESRKSLKTADSGPKKPAAAKTKPKTRPLKPTSVSESTRRSGRLRR
jgi:uncharacterized protein YdeI (YjbR/CyaY-like superfamily)